MKTEVKLNKKQRIIVLNLLCWGSVFATSLFWSSGSSSNEFDTYGFVRFASNMLSMLAIYLFNYLLFIPSYLFKGKRAMFALANLVLIVCMLSATYITEKMGLYDALRPENFQRIRGRGGLPFITKDLINYILMIGLVTALRLAQRLEKSEAALKEAESARVKAELDNLRSQINPHFLLNTLNNIYALTTIDTDKAQKTIKELSDLLRYVLYDNLNEKVPLLGEVEFLKSYIELMSIRLPRKVSLSTQFTISPHTATQISPLIFISLIENGFKHSISPQGEGFIDINFVENEQLGHVTLSIKNSNHSKCDRDKSGHGIGLEQVKKRLELLYGGSYEWQIEQNDTQYSSNLTIKTAK